jgi:hypothetical protein
MFFSVKKVAVPFFVSKNKTPATKGNEGFLAENEGFEPPVPYGTTVFKTAAFDHSANSPLQK